MHPVNDAVGELLGLINGYSYAGGNPVNRVDPSGMCWVNNSASPDQQTQCRDAWDQYTSIITNTYTQSWPRNIQILVSQEARYWANLPYSEFVSQWNSSRLPGSTDPGGDILQSGLPIVGGVSSVNPLLGPQDIIAGIGLLCVAGLAVLASSGTMTLPLRPQYDFARRSGPRITWEQDYQAAKDATGACVACATATLLNPKFCNVNIVSGEGCPGCHIHVYKFHQDKNCFCRIGEDDPDIICLANPYAGPAGGPHFPLVTPIASANPELAICTGGWIQK